jgi:hypothetical protein
MQHINNFNSGNPPEALRNPTNLRLDPIHPADVREQYMNQQIDPSSVNGRNMPQVHATMQFQKGVLSSMAANYMQSDKRKVNNDSLNSMYAPQQHEVDRERANQRIIQSYTRPNPPNSNIG